MKKQKTKVVALYSLAAIVCFLAICHKAMALEPRVWWWKNTSGENDPGIALSWEVEVPTTYSFEGEMHDNKDSQEINGARDRPRGMGVLRGFRGATIGTGVGLGD